jgi:hypothetical protein
MLVDHHKHAPEHHAGSCCALQVLELLPRHHNGAMQDTLQARLAEQMEVSLPCVWFG